MDEIANYRKAKRNKASGQKFRNRDFSMGVLDVIENDYPDRYELIIGSSVRVESLFSDEEWLDILTKSRKSYARHIAGFRKKEKHKV